MTDFVIGAGVLAGFLLAFSVFQYFIIKAQTIHDQNERDQQAHQQRLDAQWYKG